MIDDNKVFIAGRLTEKKFHKGKKDDSSEFASLTIVTNANGYGGERNKNGAFINVMVFTPLLVEYIRKADVVRGQFTIVNGFLTNTRSFRGMPQLSVVAKDIVFAKSADGEDNPNTENAIYELGDEDPFVEGAAES